jgi:hypothetical protein
MGSQAITIEGKAVLVTGANRQLGQAPDPMSETMAESWRAGAAKQLERQNAALVEAQPLAG